MFGEDYLSELIALRRSLDGVVTALVNCYAPDTLPLEFLDSTARLRTFVVMPVLDTQGERARGFIQIEQTMYQLLAITVGVVLAGNHHTAEYIRDQIYSIVPLLQACEKKAGFAPGTAWRDYDYR